MSTEKVIMYDSPEAGRLVTVTVWEVDNPNGIIYTPKEHTARWNNCTHLLCDCGNIRTKHWLVCDQCRRKKDVENYNKREFKVWDGEAPVCEWDGDKYFFSLEELEDYMFDNGIEVIELLFCDPIGYSQIDLETIAGETHEGWEPEKKLLKAIDVCNKVIKELPPHSWTPGKIRTSHKLNSTPNVQGSDTTEDDQGLNAGTQNSGNQK